MKTDFEIAIPSYARAETVVGKTLAYLDKTDVNFRNIKVFVASATERDDYVDAGVASKMIVIGKPTLKNQRNFMRQYYKPGTNVLFIDDDISGLYYAPTSNNKDLQLVTGLDGFVRRAFTQAHKFGVSLWGVSAVLNAYFMANKAPSFDLKYIIGSFYGEVIDHSKKLDVTLEDKEDFERTIKHFIHCGKVLRFNSYAPKSNYYKEPGGMQVTRTKKRVEDSAKYLLDKYPQFCKLNTSKKNQEFTEIKLIKQ